MKYIKDVAIFIALVVTLIIAFIIILLTMKFEDLKSSIKKREKRHANASESDQRKDLQKNQEPLR